MGALTVALVALPGSSAPKSNPCGAAAQNCSQVQAFEEAEQTVTEAQQEALNHLNLAELSSLHDDDDVQVIVNSGQGWLGVGIKEITADKVKELKLPAERGVLLHKIVPESPAAKAGLKESDVITEINGQRVEGTEQFRRMIREIPAGRTVQFTVWRDGHSQTIDVALGKSELRHTSTRVAPGTFAFHMPDMPQLGELFDYGPWSSTGPRLGIDAENLDGEFGNFFGAPDGEGILVRGVFPDSPAAKAGLKVGDVITSVDGERIRSIGELREKLVEKKDETSVKLGLVRNRAALSLSVELPAPVEKRMHHNELRTNI
jgi:C-terminal processing protease CtpA/Prc